MAVFVDRGQRGWGRQKKTRRRKRARRFRRGRMGRGEGVFLYSAALKARRKGRRGRTGQANVLRQKSVPTFVVERARRVVVG